MPALSWMTSLWPGLAPLWLRGRWSGLVAAAAFAGLVQIALVSTFVWPHILSRELPSWATPAIAWILVLGFWVAGFRAGLRELSRSPVPAPAADPQIDTWFREAQSEYLKGHWFEAESLLAKLLARQANDAEARLLLASIERRTKRLSESRQTLQDLKQSPTAAKWWLEIETELTQLAELEPSVNEPINPEQNQLPLTRAA